MTQLVRNFILILSVSNFVSATHAHAAFIFAESCSQSDVQTAIDSATDGDTVVVPAGNCAWKSAVRFLNKQITIQGAGIDQTTITDETTSEWWQSPFWITGAEGKPFRITGFSFNGASDGNGVIHIDGTCREFRVDHCKFEDIEARAIDIFGYTYGVIDHCEFLGNISAGLRVADVNNGDDARLRPVDLGTAHAVYVEDCTFAYDDIHNSQAAIDAQSGGCFVFRHNSVTRSFVACHGTESGYPQRGVYYYEVYENVLSELEGYYVGMLFRGGTGVIHNNSISGFSEAGIFLANYRTTDPYGEWGMCDGSSSFDGNEESSGYPCVDQVGRGQESYNPPPGDSQALEAVYEWNNHTNGGQNIDCYVRSVYQAHIQENRDYFNDTQKPGYTPYTYPHPLTIVDQPYLLAGPGPGYENPTVVRVFPSEQDASPVYQFNAYSTQHYGVDVSSGNLTEDLESEVLTGAGPGAAFGPHVRGFRVDGTPLPGLSFLAYGTNNYGVNVAAGDLDADGFDEIITGAGPGALFGPHVRAFDYDGTPGVTPLPGVSFFAYGTPKWGVNVSAGDIEGDGSDEIITGAGPGSVYGPHVRGWNVDAGAATAMSGVNFFAYGTNKYGVNVTCGDLDGDGFDEIVTGAGPGQVFGAHVRGWNYDGAALSTMSGVNFFAWQPGKARYGAKVSADTDLNDDGRSEMVVGFGPDPEVGTEVKVFLYDGTQVTEWFSLDAFEDMGLGTNVAAGRF